MLTDIIVMGCSDIEFGSSSHIHSGGVFHVPGHIEGVVLGVFRVYFHLSGEHFIDMPEGVGGVIGGWLHGHIIIVNACRPG